jgi:hypothetical protein
MIALSEGHQCHPSLLNPLAMTSPFLPTGSGGRWDFLGGYAGFPSSPETPIIRSF